MTELEPYPGDPAHRVMCQHVVELLGEYLEGALEPALLADVDRHLEACPPCREFLDQLRTTVGLLGGLPQAKTIPDPMVDLLVSTFREFTGPKPQAQEP